MVRKFSGILLSMALVLSLIIPTGVAQAAIITVTTTSDSGTGSLRQAITDAGPGDTIIFSLPGGSVIYLSTGELVISQDLTISGPGAAHLTISGSNLSSVFRITGGTVSIYGLAIVNGSSPVNGGGINNEGGTLTLSYCTINGNFTDSGYAGAKGGGIYNNGTLQMSDCTISNNEAGDGGTGNGGHGGGIYNNGVLTLTRCTFNDNSAGDSTGGNGGCGAGIYNQGRLEMTNCTISGNSAGDGLSSHGGDGGGIFNNSALEMSHCTISNNHAGTGNTSPQNGSGGGICADATAMLKNTIVAGNTATGGPDCYSTFVSRGGNLIQDSSGSSGWWDPGDITGQDPLLETLANHGGSTDVHALPTGSPAIDTVTNCTDIADNPVSTDQRGVARPIDGDLNGSAQCDIGAYEAPEPSGVMDFGDAPDPGYPTLLARDGARHYIVSTNRLGSSIDCEADGQPTLYANGDDYDDGNDDEDGVVFTSALLPGQQASITVNASVSGKLDAWLDFNDDDDWLDASEQIFTNQPLTTGDNNLSFPVPAWATPTPEAYTWTFARFRFSTAGNLTFDGLADDGEVEDYHVEIEGIPISGTTGAVNCTVLGDVTLDLIDSEETMVDSTTSDSVSGNYTLFASGSGTYTVKAGKTGFHDRTQQVTVGTDPVDLDFVGNTGLMPKAAEMSCVLECVNHWLYPVGECGLEMSTVLAVVNAWLYPT